jgi:hypothetical protein
VGPAELSPLQSEACHLAPEGIDVGKRHIISRRLRGEDTIVDVVHFVHG